MTSEHAGCPDLGNTTNTGESVAEVICRLIEVDPHQWSTRPCQTCKAISALVNRPFGCVKRAKERGDR